MVSHGRMNAFEIARRLSPYYDRVTVEGSGEEEGYICFYVGNLSFRVKVRVAFEYSEGLFVFLRRAADNAFLKEISVTGNAG